MITPFKANMEIDWERLGSMLDYVIDGGTDYIVALGTTAETPTLTKEEKRDVIRFVKQRVAGRVPIVVGAGGNNTLALTRELQEMELDGVEAILSVTPYYNKPSQEGLYQHFKTVAEHSPLPVILYNIPGRTGVNMTAETTLRLAREIPNIIGIKEASGNLEQMQQIIDNRPEGFLVLAGDDGIAIELMERGGDGVISVAANVFPQLFMACINKAKEGKYDEARAAWHEADMDDAVEALFAEGNPVGAKCALSVMGKIGPTMRLPLVPGTAQLRERFKMLIEKYDLH